MAQLEEFASGIWIKEYPINYAGCTLYSRMTVIKLSDGNLLLHSPCEIDDSLKTAIEKIGPVAFIVAPGNFHHLHVPSCQRAFPSAKTYICPGVEKKRKDITYSGVLDNDAPPPAAWATDLELVLIRGNRIISEVAFFHKPSRTLILVDSIENIGDETPGTNWVLRFWWFVLQMWNRPRPAPEYQMGWKRDKTEARESMEHILDWDFDQVIIAHGDNITADAKETVRQAWKGILESEDVRCCR